MKLLKLIIAITMVLIANACGGGGGSTTAIDSNTNASTNTSGNANTNTPSTLTVLKSSFHDAPVAGLCYAATPSNKTGTTDSGGNYEYVAGDSVTFWIDGSGIGCGGITATSSTNVMISRIQPSGAVTFVLSLPQGPQAANAMTALNVGSVSVMNLSGLKLKANDISDLNTYTKTGILPSSVSGSIDNFFKAIQANTTTAGGAQPAFLTSVAALPQVNGFSALEAVATQQLIESVNQINNVPPTLAMSVESLSFSVRSYSSVQYSSQADQIGRPYSGYGGNFIYYDGTGNQKQIGLNGFTGTRNENFYTLVGTNIVSGSRFNSVVQGNYGGGTYVTNSNGVVHYGDGNNSLSTGSYTISYPSSNGVYGKGVFVASGTKLKPLTLADLSGRTIVFAAGCANDTNLSLSFSLLTSGATLNATPVCVDGSPLPDASTALAVNTTVASGILSVPTTVRASALPGILQLVDASGNTASIGLIGTLVGGSNFAVVQEYPAISLKSTWYYSLKFVSFN